MYRLLLFISIHSLLISLTSCDNSNPQVNDQFISPESSWIKSASFVSNDGLKGELTMNTKRGDSYTHADVPVDIWKSFKLAKSKGQFYNSHLRNKYRHPAYE